MKTHSQTRGKRPFDWNAALAKDCADMTKAEVRKMYENASTWVTCACGNQCSVIPRDMHGQPTDENLRILGMQFTDSISNMAHWFTHDDQHANASRREAIKNLIRIERASQKLIDAEVKKAMNVLRIAGRLPEQIN